MQYTVTITKKHCEGRRYGNITNCPLCAAIREHLPNFQLISVGGCSIGDVEGNIFFFDYAESTGWTPTTIKQLLSGEIDKYVLTFWGATTNEPGSIEPKEEETRTRIKYVSVPCSITEQTKELIMQ